MKRAQVHLYYGGGKGKSTAAFGQAVRAWGRGWRVLFAQFLKDARDPSSEVAAAAALAPRFRLLRAELPASAIADPGPRGRRLLPVAAVRRAMLRAEARGARLVILTGRWVSPALLREADLATELTKVKHPFDRGAKPVHGIDF